MGGTRLWAQPVTELMQQSAPNAPSANGDGRHLSPCVLGAGGTKQKAEDRCPCKIRTAWGQQLVLPGFTPISLSPRGRARGRKGQARQGLRADARSAPEARTGTFAIGDVNRGH